jgi:cytochrome c peroxidase
MLTHNILRAKIGYTLFRDKRLAASPRRICLSCHSLSEGGIDGKKHSGLLTRPVHNAVFSSVFMSDGSISNLADVVRIMIEDPRFAGGPSISNLVAVLSKDEKTLRHFQMAYEDGVTQTNILDSIVQYHKTLISPLTKFDRFASGVTNVYDSAELKGSRLFTSLNCVSCHDGPVLGGRKTHDGVKVPALRGLSTRSAYQPDGFSGNLAMVLMRMPCGELEKEDRIALIKFLKTL